MRKLSILAIAVLFWSCSKDEQVGIIPFKGNDIDSVVYYSINNGDTTSFFAKKITYSSNKKTINEQWYEKVEGKNNLVPTILQTHNIVNYKLISKVIHLTDTTTYEYKFNSNNFVIWYTKRNNKNAEFDSTHLEYDDNNYLFSSYSFHLNVSGEVPYPVITKSSYTWENGNLTKINSRQTVEGFFNNQTTTTLHYGTIDNPLDYNYANGYTTPYLKYGKSSRNLIENENYLFNGNLTYYSTYTYQLLPNSNSFISKSSSQAYHTITKIFYSKTP